MLRNRRRVARETRVVQHLQLRSKPRRLGPPVENQRFRNHHQRRTLGLRPPRLEHRQHLRRLADPHVIRKAAAETELAQELHPADPLALIIAKVSREALRLRRRAHSPERPYPLADAREHFVHVHLGLRRQHRVQQPGLVAAETQMAFLRVPEPGKWSESLQPLLR